MTFRDKQELNYLKSAKILRTSTMPGLFTGN